MRALRALLITLVVLGGIFVAVDRAVVYFAESEAEKRVSIPGATIGDTDVSIKGFPFLTQAVAAELDEVDVSISGIQTDTEGRRIRISRMDATLRDVRLTDGFSGVTAAAADGKVLLTYGDLSSTAGDGIAIGYGGDGKVKVTASVALPGGQPLSRSVLSSVTLVNGSTLRVRADKVPGEGIPVVEDLVRKKTDFERQVGGLPSGLEFRKIQPTAEGIEVTVAGTNVKLAG
ncbi:LmeA family phospholipid-binding protein [Streptomyces sp. PTD5-9]|uniref:LmeA family phospholipid-binding protein n=1 Tax=Streptomyces sp. PTD5-9 TaxID=3120150 RepID=UPI00300B1ECC